MYEIVKPDGFVALRSEFKNVLEKPPVVLYVINNNIYVFEKTIKTRLVENRQSYTMTRTRLW